MRFTKIVCTIGLKTEKKEYLSALVDAGMNMMRLNFSHWDFDEHWARIKTLREIMKEKWKYVAILVDTPGPEIRTWKLNTDSVVLEKWSEFTLCSEEIIWDKTKVFVTYENLYQDVVKGNLIFVNDWMIHLRVKEIKDKNVVCEVEKPWILTAKRWINLPWIKVNLPALTEDDKQDILRWCKQWVDYVAASFVRNAQVVNDIRYLLAINGGQHIKIISKIENQEWIDNFEEILEVSDGIMIARWDMWTEIPLYEVPLVQKMMIKRANDEWKIVITATEMLESMIINPRPTRAEVTDIANAVFDGTDAVMLSGETAKHNCKYPVEAVEHMSAICERVDKDVDGTQFDIKPVFVEREIEWAMGLTDSIAKWSVETARHVGAKLIVAVSVSGRTARKIRKYFPEQAILVLTPHEITARQVSLVRGIFAEVISSDVKHFSELLGLVKKVALKKWFVDLWDLIVLTGSSDLLWEGKTDMLKIIKV